MTHRWLVTGALGCIGAWVVRQLLERGDDVTVFDRDVGDPFRLRDLVEPEALARVRLVEGDVTDAVAVRAAFDAARPERVVHLAGLQVPACRADPAAGARVNVLGTLHVFEAARAAGVARVAYASSAAVYGPQPDGAPPPDETSPAVPLTHYGVFKCANEAGARVFWNDARLSSVGLRPLTVYGPGRDQGMTSDPTRAMKAAVLGRPFGLRFSSATDLQYAPDVAAAFVAAAERGPDGAHVFNLHGHTASMHALVELLRELLPDGRADGLSVADATLPIPAELDGHAVEGVLGPLPRTPLREGVVATLRHFERRLSEGRLATWDLEQP